MGDRTGIEWTDATWNPIRGCTRVSEGCRHCYAELVAARFSKPGQPYEGLAKMTRSGPRWTGRIMLVESALAQPLKWTRPRVIFVNSMSDLFHPGVPSEYVAAIFGVMALSQRHTFQVLTKRPERMRQFMQHTTLGSMLLAAARHHLPPNTFRADVIEYAVETVAWPLPNVWLGVSAEDQATFDERVPLLIETPAAVRWVSAEPLLGPIDANGYLAPVDVPSCGHTVCDCSAPYEMLPGVDWIVAGGESGRPGSGIRPMHPAWATGLRDQCVAAGVPFFFKQWGNWVPISHPAKAPSIGTNAGNVHSGVPGVPPVWMAEVGKRTAGAALEGQHWFQYPSQHPSHAGAGR